MAGEPYWLRGARLLATIGGGGPAICTIQVTNRCNMHCSFCAFWSDGAPPPEELTLAQIERIAEKLGRMGSFIISVEGGEPLLRPDIVDLVGVLGRRHHPVLYTNGWHVDAAKADALVEAGLVGVGVSIDYAEPARHDAHRLPGAFARAVDALAHFRRAPWRWGGGRQVHVMTVLMDDNFDEVEPLLRLSQRLGVRHRLTVLALDGHNRAGGKQLPRNGVGARLLALKRRYSHFAVLTDYLAGIDSFLHGRFDEPCQAGRRGFNINHVGETNPCIELTDVSVGKFLDVPADQLLARLRGERAVEGCQKCYTICRGNVQALGRPLALRPLVELLG